MGAVLNNTPTPIWNNARSEIVERLLADTCELCGSRDQVQVHYIRALKELRRTDRTELPDWAQVMVARQRKKLVVCHRCHLGIHHGTLRDRTNPPPEAGEPDAVKAACPVRRGLAEKGWQQHLAASLPNWAQDKAVADSWEMRRAVRSGSEPAPG